jgi:Tol biopolymer transport system component/PKD repeat protein
MSDSRRHTALAVTVVLLLAMVPFLSLASGGTTEMVSVASDGTRGDGDSREPAVSADGRYVAFESQASNLVADDTNGTWDIFVHDRQTGETERVSVASDGTQANGGSFAPELSTDGRYVAFESWAGNLTADATYLVRNIFVHDRQTGETERVSVASDGSGGNDRSVAPALSADGRYVAFASWASNLVADDTNGTWDIFVHDRQTGETERVSVASDGTQGNDRSSYPALSADGRYVAFESQASNLVADDTNLVQDIFVHDRQTGETERVSVASDGSGGNYLSFAPALNADGGYVAFSFRTSALVAEGVRAVQDIFVHDRQTGETERVSVASDGTQGDDSSLYPALSADGRYVAFESGASNLVADDTNGAWDIFVHDRQTGETERVSVASDGSEGNYYSHAPALSVDERYVAFMSLANNLVMNDIDFIQDIFIRDRQLILNDPPIAEAGTDQTVNEGDMVTLDGSASSDPDGDPLTYSWELVDSEGPMINLSDDTAIQPTFTATDDGTYTFALTVDDGKGGTDTDQVVITVDNVDPILGAISAPVDPVAINTEIQASADFSDPGLEDTHAAIWDWGDGSQCDTEADANCMVSTSNGDGTAAGSHTYSKPGVYTVSVTVTDDDGGSDTSVYEYVTVYDPDGGSVRGNGTIESPAGACQLTEDCEDITGIARFGFSAKYKPGTNEVTGKTQFRFQAAGIRFQSSSYDWLVVAGARAQFKGSGTINGAGEYEFMLTAIDGDLNGGEDEDALRFKLKDKATGTVVYDNHMGEDDDYHPTTALTTGSITIQKQ